MNTKKIFTLCAILSIIIIIYSCKKIDIPNTNTVNVTLSNKASNYITGNVSLNPSTPFAINFTISCPTDIETVFVSRNGTIVTTDVLTTDKRNFTADKSFVADAAPGVYTYRIWARDLAGKYLGEKNIVVTVTSDFYYYTVKNLLVPDTTAKTNPTYYSSSSHEVLSYTGMGTKSASIDFGYFFDPVTTGTPAVANGHTIYALNITPVPSAISMYDLASFTKNATIFKRVTSPTFATVNSSTVLQSAGVANLASGTSTFINKLVAGNTILFKTVSGKYGMIQVNYVNQDQPWKSTFMNIDVKIQK
jgi:hypothetical protein